MFGKRSEPEMPAAEETLPGRTEAIRVAPTHVVLGTPMYPPFDEMGPIKPLAAKQPKPSPSTAGSIQLNKNHPESQGTITTADFTLKAGMGSWKPPASSSHQSSSQLMPPPKNRMVVGSGGAGRAGATPPLTVTGVAPWARHEGWVGDYGVEALSRDRFVEAPEPALVVLDSVQLRVEPREPDGARVDVHTDDALSVAACN